MTSASSEAAAAVRIGAGLALRKRAELLALLRPCFARTGPWLQAGKYAAAVMSELPERNGWSIARQAGDRTPDKTQRLLNHASWDTFAAMGVVRRFAAAGLEQAARRGRRRGGLVIGAIDETGQEKAGEATCGVKRQYLGSSTPTPSARRNGGPGGNVPSACRHAASASVLTSPPHCSLRYGA